MTRVAQLAFVNQALLGREAYATTQRYAVLAPDAHSKVLESWSRRTATGATR